MAKLALVYGLRLLPSDDLESIGEGCSILLKNGRKASINLHLIEGSSEEEIRKQLFESLDAFFEFYPEV